jgi:hypothetical protein
MPTYVWSCSECGEIEVFRPISQYAVPPEHPHPVTRVISACMGFGDIKPYIARAGDMAGKPITSRVEHRKFLKRNRLVELGDAPVKSTQEFRKTTSRQEVRESLKRAIAQHTIPDMKRGGLIERHR